MHAATLSPPAMLGAHEAGSAHGMPDLPDIPAQDWQGQPITPQTCSQCAHAELRHDPRQPCEPARSCVQDVYARRIDRFFRHRPALANGYLAHPYFEVR